MAATITLYPPVVDTYVPAQVSGNTLRVYFSLSDYNTYSEIQTQYTQVTIADQESNLSVLDKSLYPSQIMLKTLGYDSTRLTNPYYIDIASTDGNFTTDKFYKVQIRFTSTEASAISTSTPQQLDAWLSQNLDFFSEWSRVTLIKYISANDMYVNNVKMKTTTAYNVINIPVSNAYLTGELKFDNESKEYLNSYKISLYHSSDLLVDSGVLYTDKNAINPNTFEYKLKYALTIGESYTLKVSYQTNSLYERETYATINVTGNSGSDQGFVFSAKENLEDGEMTIRISRISDSSFTGKLTVKRASDDTNFTIWEDMYTFELSGVTNYTNDWIDQTVESGVLYKYALLEEYNSVSYLKNYDKILMLVLDDMFLYSNGKSLKIKFNPQVSSFKQVINEGKIETIGSQYPYIRRNAAINYAQFPISGLISCQMDENEKFISKEELYGGHDLLRKYEKFNTREEYIPFITTVDNDFVYEKKFRDAVKTFLMDGNIKLFRSATEGNYLVKLTEVSFSPNQQLGRMIWTFSATANEIADNTVDNYIKYNIL